MFLIPVFIVGLFVAGFFVVVGLAVFMVFRLASGAQSARQLRADEGQMLQETWKQLDRFEARLANLETILMNAKTPQG